MRDKYVKSKMELAKARAALGQGIKTDLKILGTGPLNRDGVPQLPPDQREVKNWPVLDLGIQPDISLADWTLQVSGCVDRPTLFDQKKFLDLPQTEDTSDFHCVTGWSRLGVKWRGVRLSEIAKTCGLQVEARFVYVTAFDNYSTNLPLDEALKYDVLLVYEADGKALAKEHGGPVRMITPQLWAWKGAKWIRSIEFLPMDRRGFWEERGYSNSAIPWLNDRYTADEQD